MGRKYIIHPLLTSERVRLPHIFVKLLKEEFGYDDAFNYNTETDFDAALKKFFVIDVDVAELYRKHT
ncbi:hypothetical protein L1049_025092 [Liquidambar formosana]|uniref:Uncharacterized protein n=1 Tax=Liquidambar formosana TaxID=63359 RepID=A0AAP0RW26_LIQFO